MSNSSDWVKLWNESLIQISNGQGVSNSNFQQLHQCIQSLCSNSHNSTIETLERWYNEFMRCIGNVLSTHLVSSLMDGNRKLCESDPLVLQMDKFVTRLVNGRMLLADMYPHIVRAASVQLMNILACQQYHTCGSLDTCETCEWLLLLNKRIEDTMNELNITFVLQNTRRAPNMESPLPRHIFARTKNSIRKMPGPIQFSSTEAVIPDIKKTDLPLERKAFILENVLTPEECKQLIEKSCELGYDNMETEFPGNKRMFIMVYDLATELWKRIQSFIESDPQLFTMIPFGFNTHGNWRPSGLNPCFNFCAYFAPCTGILPHRDANFIADIDNQSIFTCMIYLNEDFEDGTINFLTSGGSRMDETIAEELKRGYSTSYRLKPKTGMAVIFEHLLLHEAAPVSSGNKFIARTEIVFNRYHNPYPDLNDWQEDPNYCKMLKYYREAAEAEHRQQIDLSSELYERALSIRQNYVRKEPK